MDLDFIADQLSQWPDDSLTSVRLDSDGEIVFEPFNDHDFYPDDLCTARAVFEPGEQCKDSGAEYTKAQWEQQRVRSRHDRY